MFSRLRAWAQRPERVGAPFNPDCEDHAREQEERLRLTMTTPDPTKEPIEVGPITPLAAILGCLEDMWVSGSWDLPTLDRAIETVQSIIRDAPTEATHHASDEAVELGPDGKEWAKTTAGYRYVESRLPDAAEGAAGLVWYGHVVREAFVAGAEWQEARAAPTDVESLRDWFAGQALAQASRDIWENHKYEDVAKRAYGIANAMLAERDHPGDTP